ncbi:Replication protein A 70 kDa DNA-binding subunit B [Zea mays]|uniref:Replication protein A 70 kDa DNA-binding subunit B n=1 Tax=Zea mays TaxID=4577 RepID=A0A1D6EMN3_MAIZE|nr:Replication protein A 70 kDa DNA-binding subunit B [Zea mays]
MGGQATGYAAADAVQALPLVSTFWGVLLFGEYHKSSRKTYVLLGFMLFMFVAVVAVLMASKMSTNPDEPKSHARTDFLLNNELEVRKFWDENKNDLATRTGQELLDMVDSSPIVAIKSLKVSDFQGVSLPTIGRSTLEINPDLLEAKNLMSWYVSEGKDISLAPISAEAGATRAGGFKYMYSDRVFLSHITSDPAMGQEKEGDNSYVLKLKEATWVPHMFRVSVTQDEYMNEKRQRITVRGEALVDFAA